MNRKGLDIKIRSIVSIIPKHLFLIIFLLWFSCSENERTNQEKIVGSWKRTAKDRITGIGGIVDTFTFTSTDVTIRKNVYKYKIDDSHIYYFVQSDTVSYCYKFLSDHDIKLDCFFSPGGSTDMNLVRI